MKRSLLKNIYIVDSFCSSLQRKELYGKFFTGYKSQTSIDQMQAYACTDDLKQKCIDPRYTYISSILVFGRIQKARAGLLEKTTELKLSRS